MLAAPFLLLHCGGPDFEVVSERRILMDTYVAINVYAPRGSDQQAIRQQLDLVWRRTAALDSLFSNYRDDSETAHINHRAGQQPVKVSPVMFGLLQRAQEISALSNGAFDITVGRLVELWGFGRETAVPAPDSLAAYLANVGSAFMHLQPNDSTIGFDRPGIHIDVGGIAKGAIIDSIYQMLAEAGYQDFMIDAGGDLRMRASDLTAGRRNVWITHPRREGSFLARFKLDNGAVATTGDYERFFLREGRRYHHILDPKTGMPSDKAVSVTVVAQDAVTADALATAFFVMGPNSSLALARQLPGIEAMIVTEDGNGLRFHLSDSLASQVHFLDSQSEP